MIRTHRGIDAINGDIADVQADGVGYGELALIRNPDGEQSLAQIVRIDRRRVSLQVFAGTRGLSVDASVRFLGRAMQLRVSDQLLGRVLDGSGRPRDGKPPLREGAPVELAGPSVNPVRRVLPSRLIETGIPMIDVFNPLVESQKLPIFSEAGEPTPSCSRASACRPGPTSSSSGASGCRSTRRCSSRRPSSRAG